MTSSRPIDCANPGCTRELVGMRPGARFCSAACRTAAYRVRLRNGTVRGHAEVLGGVPIDPRGTLAATTTWLYRMVGDRRLLYVGITDALDARFAAHARVQSWWPEVEEITVRAYATRTAARRAELAAIRNDDPYYNIADRPVS